MADEPAADPPAETDQGDRIDRIEGKVDHLAELVAKVLPGHAEAQENVEQRLDRPSTVEEQVKAELAKAQRETAEREAREQRDAEFTSVKDQVAKLTEKAPEPPVRRATRWLGWGP